MSPSRKISRAKTKVQQPAAQSYEHFLSGIKERIRTAQVKAVLAANAELVLHYWELGQDILANQRRQGWGARVIDRLSIDLQQAFPKLAGYQAAVDNLIKTPGDGPTIGLILCRGKNKTVVEYTLRDAKSPLGVAEYRLLPSDLKTELPGVQQLKNIVTAAEPSDR